MEANRFLDYLKYEEYYLKNHAELIKQNKLSIIYCKFCSVFLIILGLASYSEFGILSSIYILPCIFFIARLIKEKKERKKNLTKYQEAHNKAYPKQKIK